MSRNSSNAVRIKEKSKLLVKCIDANWESFSEQTETQDISETGISFYLNSPVWVDTHLTIKIASSGIFGRLRSLTAKVVRVQVDASGKQLVAARFNE
jgi:PilZ domain-containing protein